MSLNVDTTYKIKPKSWVIPTWITLFDWYGHIECCYLPDSRDWHYLDLIQEFTSNIASCGLSIINHGVHHMHPFLRTCMYVEMHIIHQKAKASKLNHFGPSENLWYENLSQYWLVNIGYGRGLLPCIAKPLAEKMLICCQFYFIWTNYCDFFVKVYKIFIYRECI